MTEQLKVFGIVLLVNLILVLLYWVINLPQKEKGERKPLWISGVVMLLCPVIGPCFFLLAHLFLKVFFNQPVDLEGVIFSKERVRTFIRADEESERNN